MKLQEEYKARRPPSVAETPSARPQAPPRRGEVERGETGLKHRWRRGAALRRRWRRRVARFLLLLFVFFGLTAGTAPTSHDLFTQVDALTHARQFDFVDWISMAIAGEIGRHLEPPPLPSTYREQRALIETFLAQEREIRRLEEQIDQLYASSGADSAKDSAELAQTVAGLRGQQQALLPQVERLLAQQVEAVLEEEGFTLRGRVFPPV